MLAGAEFKNRPSATGHGDWIAHEVWIVFWGETMSTRALAHRATVILCFFGAIGAWQVFTSSLVDAEELNATWTGSQSSSYADALNWWPRQGSLNDAVDQFSGHDPQWKLSDI